MSARTPMEAKAPSPLPGVERPLLPVAHALAEVRQDPTGMPATVLVRFVDAVKRASPHTGRVITPLSLVRGPRTPPAAA